MGLLFVSLGAALAALLYHEHRVQDLEVTECVEASIVAVAVVPLGLLLLLFPGFVQARLRP